MEPRRPKWSPGGPNGAQEAHIFALVVEKPVTQAWELLAHIFALVVEKPLPRPGSFSPHLRTSILSSIWASWAPFGPPGFHLGLLGSI